MRILLVSDYGTPTGGAELQSLLFRDGLRTRGHDARWFSSRARPGGAPIAADVTCLGTQGRGRAVLQAVNPWAAARLRHVLRAFRPDIVHVRMFLSQLSPLVLRELRDVPTMLHVVNYQLICPLNTKVLPDGSRCGHRAGRVCQTAGCISMAGWARFDVQRRMWRAWGGHVDTIVANSAWTAARLAADGVTVDGTMHYGVPDPGPRAPLTEVPSIAFVGRLFPKKGTEVLLRAMAVVRGQMPGVRLVIVGDGPERQLLERLTADLQLGNAVTFTGFVPRGEIPARLAGTWVQVVPSTYEEPFGVVVPEAMMRGTAVVASNVGGPTEVVRHGDTGLLVPAGDVTALAIAILELVRDRDRADYMGRTAREVARRDYTVDASIERLLAWYDRTLTRFRSARVAAGGGVPSAGRPATPPARPPEAP